MNMKKSIAGVMAGAMAVSAMATAVSAQDSVSLNYDLKTYVNNPNDKKPVVTLVATYEKVLLDADASSITFSSNNGFIADSIIYNDNQAIIGNAKKDDDGNWISAQQFKGISALKDLEFTAQPYKNYTGSSVTSGEYQTVKLSKDNKTDGSVQTSNPGYLNLVKDYSGVNAWTSGAFNLAGYDLSTLGYSNAENAKSEGLSGPITTETYGFYKATAKLTYEIPNKVKINNSNSWSWTATDANTTLNIFGDSAYTEETMTTEIFNKGFNDGSWGKRSGVVATLSTGKVLTPATSSVGSFEAGAAGDAKYPFKTTLNPSFKTKEVTNADGSKTTVTIKDNDVVAALQSRKEGGNYYTKPIAVLNDAIANHDNVTFTFTGYTERVATAKSHVYYEWVEEGRAYEGYNPTPFDWYNPTFGQHLYTTGTYGDYDYSLFDESDFDNYGSKGENSLNWKTNLFTGAIVVNSQLTMQLSDTAAFQWGTNTLSFNWFDITDEGKITDAKTFLTSMLLYTPVDWYWDSLSVVVSDDEDEAIDAGEGLDGEGDVIDDEPEVEEEPEIEEEPEVEETEAAPVETAPSPATGNAPVALAVIPVALAAAAVVAKKRG